MSVKPIPAHMICDIPGKPNVSKIYPPKRLKPGPARHVPRNQLREQRVTVALNDIEVAALDAFRKAHAVIGMPTRSAFIAYVLRQYFDNNRRRDLPGIVSNRANR